jgi:pimeloyl-ACP methyl ester carboxylesterase
VRQPELLVDLTLINAVGYDLWPVQPITSLRTPILRQLMMASLDMGALRVLVKRAVYHHDRVTDELMDLFMKPLRNSEGRKAFVQFARSLDNQDLMTIAEDLGRLGLPALIIRGEADPFLPAEIAHRLHTGIPGSRLVSIPTASHFAQIDEPAIIAEEFLAFAGSEDA